jgi:glycosyltransferase involved in cell wall biosynthesis
MRITFLLPGYPWTPMGGFRTVYEYANCLIARGHEVSVVHARSLRNAPPEPVTTLRRWVGANRDALRDRLFTPKVDWQIVDSRVRMLYVPDLASSYVPDADAIFATLWATAECVLELPIGKGEKFYLIQGYETWCGPKDRVDETWRAPLHKVVVSAWLQNIGTQMGCTDIVKIANGLDCSRLTVLTPITERPKRVAMMFSHAECKGSADGITALEAAKSKHPDLQAVVFGVSRRPKGLPAWIEYHRNPPQRVLVGDIYNSARAFLCSSWAEGFALPPAEAMACGCAVVSTDCGGNRDYAEHGVTALLSSPRDPESLADNLIRILEDDDLRVRIATQGCKRIQAFTWDRSTALLEAYIKTYVDIAERKNLGDPAVNVIIRTPAARV